MMGREVILEFEIDGLPKTNPADNRHWRSVQRDKREWQASVHLATVGKRPSEPLSKARATFTRFSSVEPDDDNLRYSFKYIRDGLIKSGIIVDDAPWYLEAEYLWEKAPPKKGKVRVRVEKL